LGQKNTNSLQLSENFEFHLDLSKVVTVYSVYRLQLSGSDRSVLEGFSGSWSEKLVVADSRGERGHGMVLKIVQNITVWPTMNLKKEELKEVMCNCPISL